MIQCLKITFEMAISKKFLQGVIQKHARDLGLEGFAQALDSNMVKIIICGQKETIEDFIDILHKELAKKAAEHIEIEPFIKEKDYRGVFRVIE